MYNFEWFENKAKEVHGNKYSYTSYSYINTRVKIPILCNTCGVVFHQTPKNHLNGQGCPECGKKFAIECHKRDYKNFIKTVNERFDNRYDFPNIKEEYENSHSKITAKCKLCGKTFTKIACDIITSKTGGCWCKENRYKYVSFEEIAEKIHNYDIEPFDGLKEIAHDKVKLTCQKCGFTYEARIKSILNGKHKCKKCVSVQRGIAIRKPIEDVVQFFSENYPSITINKNTYTKTNCNIECVCNNCGHKFHRTFNSFTHLSKHSNPCPKCNKEEICKKRTKTVEEFWMDVINVHGDGKFELLSDYTKSSEKVTLKCNECGRTFNIEANSLLQGHGCPYHNCNSSTPEKEIVEHLKRITDDIIINTNDRNVLNGKEIDIYVPSKKIGIEFDGIFWHNENNKTNDYHLQKTEECEKRGIRLVHIFEDEWLNKKDIWLSMIDNMFGKTQHKVFARKCKIKNVDTKTCTDFLNRNHLQGWCPSQIKLGLYYNEELVSVMTFGKSRHFIGNGKIEYELLRFCNKIHTNVIGGASKLFAHFIQNYKPNSIVSYADRRWSVGNLYNKLNFKFEHNSKPNYFYVIGNERKNRFNYRKKILVEKYGCPVEMSEREFCKQQKWYRIYDCGTKVFKWFKEN